MRDRIRGTPMACDILRDRKRDGLKARKTATWTNAPLVRSARAAAILEFWRAKEEIRSR
jgi:hypothetical protein